MVVALFDIDGTLLSTHGAGKRALEAALIAHFGTAGPDGHRYDGKTDGQIARELLHAAGFGDAVIDERLPSVLEHYLGGLHRELALPPGMPHVHAGVRELLDALERRGDVTIGLLTGNIEGGARAKIDAAGLGSERFRVGAYGSDHERRDALPAIAQARASALLAREVAGGALVIIGDTPHDITCGRSVGARAIGVATGYFRAGALAEHAPFAVFDDLGDTGRVIEAILGTAGDAVTDLFTIPELTRGLRAFASPRALGGDDAHDRYFAPLLGARRAAGTASRWTSRVAAFDAERLDATMRLVVRSFAAERFPGSAADQRALAAQMEDACDDLFAALASLGAAQRGVQSAADDGQRSDEWRAWTAALREVFAAADRGWERVSVLRAAAPAGKGAPGRRPGRARRER